MPKYTLTIGEQADLNLHRLAVELDMTEEQILTAAINTYATLKHASADGYVYVKAHPARGDTLTIKKVALP